MGWSNDGTVTPEHLERIRKLLIEAKDIRNIRFEGLKEDRREVIAGGLAVLLAVYRTLASQPCDMPPARCASAFCTICSAASVIATRATSLWKA